MDKVIYQPAPAVRTPKLGRLPATDLLDHRFALRAPRPTRTSRTWHIRRVLDQRDTSACVGFSGTAWLDCGPVRNLTPDAGAFDSAFKLYRECQDHDEWAGAEPDYFGTSVRALFKVLQARGVVGEYRWAWRTSEIVAWVLERGPVVLGTVWSESMFHPVGRDARVKPEGDIVGGHAYLCIGANTKTRTVRCLNSWGTGYGDKGRFTLSFDDLDILMKEDGEACTAVEVKPAR